MAFLKNFEKKQDHFYGTLSIPDAYWRVDKVASTKQRAICTVSVNKKDNDHYVMVEEKIYDFIPNLDGGNFIRQAYEYLKTLPEFSGAVDC